MEARGATRIRNLPGYMHQPLGRLIDLIRRREQMRDAVQTIRDRIPEGAIEAE